MTTFVYFARCGSAIKIGISNNVASRMRTLAIGNPEPIELLGHVPGGRNVERHLHVLLREHRLRGEWFRDCPSVRTLLARVIAGDLDAPAAIDRRSPFQCRLAATARRLWPRNTSSELAARARCSKRSAENWLGNRNLGDGDALVSLLQSDAGPEIFFSAVAPDLSLERINEFRRAVARQLTD